LIQAGVTAEVIRRTFCLFDPNDISYPPAAGHSHAKTPAMTRAYTSASNMYLNVVDQGWPYQILIGILLQLKARKPTTETTRKTLM
jgi:hypothetical protein